MDDREHRIRERAHRLWEEEGRPEGRAEDHWFQAKEIVAIEEGHREAFMPVDAAAAPPVEPIEALTNASESSNSADHGEMEISRDPGAEPGIATDGGENEPVSEIDTIRRTLEVPLKRRGKVSPRGDRDGAMSGDAGRRLRN